MTNKQYENLGRAVVLEALLERERDALDNMCSELEQHLSAFIGKDAAIAYVKSHYGSNFASFVGCREFMAVVRMICNADERKSN